MVDEADQFRNPDTQLAEAIFALKAEKFWMLTGTPIHNSLRDLHPFLRILKIKPMLDYQWYTEKVINPIAGGSASSRGRAYQRLHIVLSRVMLRRRKDDMLNGKKLLDLQEMDTNLVYCELDPFEREIYEALQSRFDSILGRLLSQAAEKRNKRLYTCFWVLLLRLRQGGNHQFSENRIDLLSIACLHPSLIIKDYTPEEHEMHEVAEQEGVREERSETEGGNDRCILCGLLLTGSNVDANQHKILCGEVMELTRQKLSQHTSGSMVESSKIRMILHILEDIHQRSPKEKTIIYSQFTNMLDVIAKFLEGRYNFVFYHGKLNASQRETVLREIKTKSKVTVMLVSLKAGGSGLNLTECNNVILADLWWNPAVEVDIIYLFVYKSTNSSLQEQAFGRVHRIGQEKKVHIYKLVAANTVEGRILNMQARKQELANTALDSDEIKQVAKLSREEIVELLSDKSENELKTLASHA
ncbi:DNA helicase rad5 [Stygiomarasmius scandens]|uniref:DNA helicase rad5 n=1 Tax=Marasmiellus scandens TaxID=2682957 RepID=A0ABR1JG53_9AGAR